MMDFNTILRYAKANAACRICFSVTVLLFRPFAYSASEILAEDADGQKGKREINI